MAFRLELSDFGAFYERTYGTAYRTALGIVRDPALAADVTQEAYVAAYRNRQRYRGDAPSTAWLHRIVVNQALTALRRRPGPRPVRDISASMVPDGAGGSLARLALIEALDVLPPRQRAAVILRYYHDYDYATIARLLGTSSTNVGVMLSRALDRLKDALEPDPITAAAAGR
ncbi:MAG TPA: RNA polymerase sigma factor [Candidatus Limnocylindrales bacterium]|nr:RNA polymerase sigma factor [Candidatus Limnocylindrales bacterium]